MHPILKNILAVIAGIAIGSFVNSSIVSISGSLIPLPEGVDPNDVESIKASIHLFETKHFVLPFLAHALGTLVGAFVAAKLAVTNKISYAIGISVFFLLGGIFMIIYVPSPIGFTILDLAVAYIPMGYLGGKLATKK